MFKPQVHMGFNLRQNPNMCRGRNGDEYGGRRDGKIRADTHVAVINQLEDGATSGIASVRKYFV